MKKTAILLIIAAAFASLSGAALAPAAAHAVAGVEQQHLLAYNTGAVAKFSTQQAIVHRISLCESKQSEA